jgi:hypothetical protein
MDGTRRAGCPDSPRHYSGPHFRLDVSAFCLLGYGVGHEGMLGLESIVAGAKLRGVAGAAVVEVVRVEWIGSDALNVVYRSTDGPAEVLLLRDAAG